MPQTPSTGLTRRSALGATAAALAGAASTDPGTTGDAPLLALCREAVALDREGDRLGGAGPGPGQAAAWAEAERLAEAWERAVDQICALPAGSTESLRAKALLLRTMLPRNRAGDLHAAAGPVEALTWSLTGDLLRNGVAPESRMG